MNNFKPDLELRRQVAELAGWTELEEISSTGGTKLAGVNQCGRRSICEYDLSFDAIMPLVRGLHPFKRELLKRDLLLAHIRSCEEFEIGDDFFDFGEWLLCEATPADYCRAYVAAMKGE
jgi:hypothetical protein